jgi:hypothetical protein
MVRCQKDTRYEESIAYILERSDAFGAIPSAFATGSAGRYAQKALPMVTQQNALEFCLGAFELWSTQDRHYSSIVRGMQVTYGLICTLRNFASQTELDAPVGELAPRLEEMRVLLARPCSPASRKVTSAVGRFGFFVWIRFFDCSRKNRSPDYCNSSTRSTRWCHSLR